MTKKNEIEQKITATSSLEELLETLKGLQDDGEIDIYSPFLDIPNFGGPEPKDTMGIWSWDKKSLLVGWSIDELVIIHRCDFSIYSL